MYASPTQNPQCRDRKQRFQVGHFGGGLHDGALARQNLQSQGLGQPRQLKRGRTRAESPHVCADSSPSTTETTWAKRRCHSHILFFLRRWIYIYMDAGGGGGLFVSEVDLLCHEVLFSAVHLYIEKEICWKWLFFIAANTVLFHVTSQ